jgi:hypothetical protein
MLEDAGEHQKALDYLTVADGAGDETAQGKERTLEAQVRELLGLR